MTETSSSMTLLTEVMEKPLDPGYAEAAANRSGSDVFRYRPLAKVLIASVSVLFGLGTATAVSNLRVPQPVMRATRMRLETDIQSMNERIANLTTRTDELSSEIDALQADVLAASSPIIAELLELDTVTNGHAAVTGPGLEIVLTDGGGHLADDNPEALVRDADLQRIIQYLWSIGAEAIAVDDQRLSMTSAVRNAGDAILVDLIPLSGPSYTISAVGSPDALLHSWEQSTGPLYLQLLGNQFGISSSVSVQSQLELPGATNQSLRFAEQLE